MSVAPPHSDEIDRRQAAGLLRAARTAARHGGEVAERIEWAYASMPDNLRVLRLKIDLLLREEDVEAAESLVARALLQRPADPSLALRRARCLIARCRWRDADLELRLALGRRPTHLATLAAAAEVAAALHHHVRAARLLDLLIRRCPGVPAYRHRRIAALVSAGAIEEAAAAMDRLQRVPPELRAVVRLAEGRRLEAREALEEAAAAAEGADADDLLRRLVTLLEEIGDVERFRGVVSGLDRSTPGASLAATRVLLSLGAFDESLVRAFTLTRLPRYEVDALHTLVVAAALSHRHRLAWRAFRRLRETRRGPDDGLMAETWRRGLLGRLVRGRHGSRPCGVDPHASVLQPLLHHAVAVFERDLARNPRRSEVREHRDRCLAAMDLRA